MPEHDPVSFGAGLASRLATRSRHVCVFLGAGAARACGLPDVSGLEQTVVKALEKEQREQFERQLGGRNLEQALSRLRRIQALLEEGSGEIDGLTAAQAGELDQAVCRQIVAALGLEQADLDPMRLFAAWARRTDYHLPLELFTVNYDLLIETALEEARVPYFDGFVGSLRARFQTQLVEEWPGDQIAHLPADFVRLWKLHGSVNWVWSEDGRTEIVRLGQPVQEGSVAAIYPSDTKYEESRRVPFVVLQDRFRRALHQPETLVLISGYSFSDNDLNELLFDAASRRQRSEFVAFCHSQIPDPVAKQALRTPNLQAVTGGEAIIGGVRAAWREPQEPPPGTWEDGAITLGDFHHLAGYLARSIVREGDAETAEQLEGILAQLLGEGGAVGGAAESSASNEQEPGREDG